MIQTNAISVGIKAILMCHWSAFQHDKAEVFKIAFALLNKSANVDIKRWVKLAKYYSMYCTDKLLVHTWIITNLLYVLKIIDHLHLKIKSVIIVRQLGRITTSLTLAYQLTLAA